MFRKPTGKLLVCSIVLIASTLSNFSLAASQIETESSIRQPPSANFEDLSKLHPASLSRSNTTTGKNEEEEQIASPSVTSVHQVWTSTSSGSFNELSPEIIGKLRNDMPFLTAYALRPRLVGTPDQEPAFNELGQPVESYTGDRILQSRAGSQTSGSDGGGDSLRVKASTNLQTSASSPQRQSASQSLLPKLGNFDEFKVETSSTSKSEHQHKRKTTLKRNDASDPRDTSLNLKRRVLATASRMVKSKRNRNADKSIRVARNKQRIGYKKGGSKGSSILGRSQARTSRLRRKMNRGNLQYHMNIIRHGSRLQQSPASKTNEIDEGVKGGSRTGGTRRPFYSAAQPSQSTGTKSPDVGQNDSAEEDDSNINSVAREDRSSADGDGDADAPPKRVGDDDVEEDGDTVMVEPKFDGVDDDPEIPTEEEEGGAAGSEEDDPRERESPSSGGDDRTRRINRERPNEPEPDQADNGSDGVGNDVGSNGGGNAAGGGIGATIGGGGQQQNPTGGGSTDDADNDGDRSAERANPSANGNGSGNKEDRDDEETRRKAGESGVEFASPADDATLDQDMRRSNGSGSSASGGQGDSKTGEGNTNLDGDRDEDNGSDVDYRDEMDEIERRRKINKSNGKDSESKKNHSAGGSGDKTNCEEDGQYHEHDEKYHDEHHHGIDWLRGAIPGEPKDDYPILSRANSTNFSCRDEKYPGYYADVESRCQIFHICQADGRQDSFL